ncbi:BREX-2 system phosphatase PglZ [Actinoplanes sp. NPDC051346]|uniref:BREX-2 system phosphatase PglZ n=1 Tax=Actinoplanes sp. NPDC051346 TaxID=3155048 RepID=UPI00341547C6
MTRVQPDAIRRKVAAWLVEQDGADAIALSAAPAWNGDPHLAIGDIRLRVVPCETPLAARAALHDREESEKLVLLTELSEAELGEGILAHLSKQTVRRVDAWELVRQMFGGATLDPALPRTGNWVAAALGDHMPADGWHAPAGTALTKDHALRCLAAEILGIPHDRLDVAGLLQWTRDAAAQMTFTALPPETAKGLATYLADTAGPAAAPIMSAVRAGHGVDALPMGLLAAVLWPRSDPTPAAAVDLAVARTRLEPRFGGARLTPGQAAALQDAAEAWVDRTIDSDDEHDRRQARQILRRAESLAAEIDITEHLGSSILLPSGFGQRLRTFAAAVRTAVAAPAPAPAARAQAAFSDVESHHAADRQRLETARMALRMLRWLAVAETPPPGTPLDAVNRHVRVDGWVDRARLDLFAGDVDPDVAQAYREVYRAVDQRRRNHDEQFADLLAAATRAELEPGAMLRVEDVLDRIVQPVVDGGRRALLLIMDGMSMAAATELGESLARHGSWLELTRNGGPRSGVLAALPTVTQVSRCSLLSGRIAVGEQQAERAAFTKRFPHGILLHKGDLRAASGEAIDPDVRAALEDPARPVVAAVINTIDDALDRSEPGTVVWDTHTVPALRDLFTAAQDRVVIMVSDHGHVVDRGPEAITRRSDTSENRWRPATQPVGEGEVVVSGSRVALGGGTVVLPWREEIRYGPRKAGYHGGASPAEAVIPLLVFTAGDESALPGWAPAPVASPDWWREALTVPEEQPDVTRKANRRKGPVAPQTAGLFELPEPVSNTPPTTSPADDLVTALLASPLYRQRRGSRGILPDDRVAALLKALLAGGGRATLDTLAAHAQIPAHRIHGTVTVLRKLLQVEGYPVVTVDADGVTVLLDRPLLIEQFGLDTP